MGGCLERCLEECLGGCSGGYLGGIKLKIYQNLGKLI